MSKLTLLQRHMNAVNILKALEIRLKASTVEGSDYETALYEYRRGIRAAQSEYGQFIQLSMAKVNKGDKAEQAILDAVINLEYVTYYPKAAQVDEKGESATYMNSILDLDSRIRDLKGYLITANVHQSWGRSWKAPIINSNYLSAWVSGRDDGIVYAEAPPVSISTSLGIESQSVIHIRLIHRNDEHGVLHSLDAMATDKQEGQDYGRALQTLKNHALFSTQRKELQPLSKQLKKLVSHFEVLRIGDEYDITMQIAILEDTARLLALAESASPAERAAACANFQEQARLLQGSPQVGSQILGGILLAIGILLIALPLALAPLLLASVVAAGGCGLAGLGGMTMFHFRQQGDSAAAHNLAQAVADQDQNIGYEERVGSGSPAL